MAAMKPEQIKRAYAKALEAQNAGRLSEAVKGYTRLLRDSPRLAEAHFQLGKIAAIRPDFQKASEHFEMAAKLRPAEPAIWLAYLELAARHPNVDLLRKLLARSADGFKSHPGMAYHKGLVALRTGDLEQAELLLTQAADQGWAAAPGLIELADTYSDDRALPLLDQALKIDPKNPHGFKAKSDLLRNLGRFDDALEVARAGLALNPQSGGLYYSYTSIRKVSADDALIAQMEAQLSARRDKGRDAIFLNSAMAKAMEDTGQTGRVFGYLKTANDLGAKLYAYDADTDRALAKQYRQAYRSLRDIPAPRHKGGAVFVTGMPRSGTTLIEQILASHSKVTGGGELGILGPFISTALEAAPDWQAVQDKLVTAGQSYHAALSERFPKSAIVTDKSISTYATLGLVKQALPDARIIMVRRDARDNALSVYKNLFAFGQHRYATNLRNIARFFRMFEEQLAFWQSELEGAFFEIRYEDLIAAPEDQSRALVAAAGLEWEEACLSFYDSKRKVDTLSAAQVRQPLYSSSIGAWRAYEAEMAPFIDEYQKLGGTFRD